MSSRPYLLDHLHPSLQLFLLAMISIVLTSVFVGFGLYLLHPLFGITAYDVVESNAIANPDSVSMNANQVNAIKFIQFMSSLGLFLFPALAFAKLKFPDGDYLRLSARTNFLLVVLAIFILIAAIPVIDWTYYFNQQLKLPSFLSGLEKFINETEKDSDQLTSLFLKTPRAPDVWINLIVIAIVPAIAEELLFRGCIQQVLREWSKNIHIAVWGAAIIFSFIHFEFYGFVPRVLLGALLGYTFVWSGSLWVPIIAHAFNNGAQIVLSYLHEHGQIQFDVTSDQMEPLWLTLVASVICVGLLWLYRRIVSERKFIY